MVFVQVVEVRIHFGELVETEVFVQVVEVRTHLVVLGEVVLAPDTLLQVFHLRKFFTSLIVIFKNKN